MWKKVCFSALILLSGCDKAERAQTLVDKNLETFYDSHLLFDVKREMVQIPCSIQGKIPDWLSGALLRNGPAKFDAGGKRVNSWFDGLAMIHSFEFTGGGLLYSNRFLRSEQYYEMVVKGDLDFPGFAQETSSEAYKDRLRNPIPKRMEGIKNADVNIVKYAGQTVALTEVPLPVVFDPQNLDTLGGFPYQDSLPKDSTFESAHPQLDPANQEMINYLIRFGQTTSYVVWKMSEGGSTREVIGEIPVDLPAYMHSFAMTEHYVILVEFPFVVNPLDLMNEKKPFILNYQWKPERGTTFLVLDRASGQVMGRPKASPFFAFHHANAFESNGRIHIDIVARPNADIIDVMAGKSTDIKKDITTLQRYIISTNFQDVSHETLFDQPLEMPKVAASKVTQLYKYCYAVDYRFPHTIQDKRPLYKIDVDAKSGKEWAEDGCYPGEPIFVPRPGGQDEDDGVILSLVLDFIHHKSFLLILDARDMKEFARAEVPHAIPVGIHGYWNINR